MNKNNNDNRNKKKIRRRKRWIRSSGVGRKKKG